MIVDLLDVNYTPSRWVAVDRIVNHWTVGSAASAIARFQNPAEKASAHFLARRDGEVVLLVEPVNTAWHAGAPGWNERSVGIEHEHIPGQDWPEVQLRTSGALHAALAAGQYVANSIELDRIHVVGHRETGYPTACPGDLPIDTILEYARGEDGMDEAMVRRIIEERLAERDRTLVDTLEGSDGGASIEHGGIKGRVNFLMRWVAAATKASETK